MVFPNLSFIVQSLSIAMFLWKCVSDLNHHLKILKFSLKKKIYHGIGATWWWQYSIIGKVTSDIGDGHKTIIAIYITWKLKKWC